MKKLKFICDNTEYFINDEKIYCVLKLLGYKDNAIWRIKSKNNERYKINSLILEKILKEYKLDSKYFLKNVNKL